QGELRAYLQGKLPDYMVPAAFVELKELPLMANGKLDRGALPAPIFGEAVEREELLTPMEEIVGGIFAEGLGIERGGKDQNFFELGGHSLLATQVISRVRLDCGVELALRSLFEAPQARALAARIETELSARSGAFMTAPPPLKSVRTEGKELVLSFAQQRLWFLDQLEPGNAFYNMPAAVRVEGELNEWALAESLSEIARRHETVRTRIENVGGEAAQVIEEASPVRMPIIDLSQLGEAQRDEEARRLATAEAAVPFDLAQGPLLRLRLIRLEPSRNIVLL